MKTGWHKNTNDEYHGGAGVSSSELKLISDCPYKYKHRKHGKKTAALAKGSRVHQAVLGGSEPLIAMPHIDRRTKAGKAEYAAFVEEYDGHDICTADEYDEVMRIRDAVLAHPFANELMNGVYELSGYYNHDKYGLLKIRPDIRSASSGIIADLKTIGTSAAPESFAKQCANFYYHLSAAMYLNIANRIDEGEAKYTDFWFIVVESREPYTVACYKASFDMLHRGRELYEDALESLLHCENGDDWPAYPTQTISLPQWAM